MDGRVGVKGLQPQHANHIPVGPGRGGAGGGHGPGEFTLPQIHHGKAAYGHHHHHQHHVGSNVSSGHVSMATSNKSTSHGHFLPAIYNKTPPKVKYWSVMFTFNVHV